MQRREQAEKRKICRAMDKGTGRKEEDMQNNGEETGRKEDDAEQWRRKQANKRSLDSYANCNIFRVVFWDKKTPDVLPHQYE